MEPITSLDDTRVGKRDADGVIIKRPTVDIQGDEYSPGASTLSFLGGYYVVMPFVPVEAYNELAQQVRDYIEAAIKTPAQVAEEDAEAASPEENTPAVEVNTTDESGLNVRQFRTLPRAPKG